MSDKLQFDLVSPERLLASYEADEVVLPGVDGDFAARPGHAPVVATLRAAFVTVQQGDKAHVYFVSGGFAEVSPTGVSVLAEEAVERADISRAGLAERIVQAEAHLANASDAERAKAEAKLTELRNAEAVFVDG